MSVCLSVSCPNLSIFIFLSQRAIKAFRQSALEINQIAVVSSEPKKLRFVLTTNVKISATLKQEQDLGDSTANSPEPGALSFKKLKQPSSAKKYTSIQCTGYLKSWPVTKMGQEPGTSIDLESRDEAGLSCLVAVGRPQPSCGLAKADCLQRGQETSPGLEFSSRHAADGKFSFVDPRVTLLLGHPSQELLGSSLYEHIHNDDIPLFAHYHKRVLKVKEEIKTPSYRLRSKDGRYITVETRLKKFMNPRTKELEFIVCKHNLLVREEKYGGAGGLGSSLPGHQQHYQSDHQLQYKGECRLFEELIREITM